MVRGRADDVRRHGFALARSGWLFLLVALGYAVLAELSWAGTTFYPPSGFSVTVMLLVERRHWAAVLAGIGVAEIGGDLAHGLELTAALAYAAANMVEPLLAAALIRRLTASIDLARVRDLVIFLAVAVIGAPSASGAVGVALNLPDRRGVAWPDFLVQWWMADAVGVLVLGSLLLTWRSILRRRAWREAAPAVLATGVVTLATMAVMWWGQPLLAMVPATLLIVVGFRLGSAAVALAGAGVAFVTARAPSGGQGPWGLAGDFRDVYVQLVVGFLVAVPLLLAAALRGRDAAVAELAIASRRGALLRTASALAAATTVEDTSRVVREHAAVLLGSSSALLAVADGGDLVTIGPDPLGPVRPRLVPWDGPIGHAIREDRRVEATTPAELREHFPDVAARLEPFGGQALVAVPLPALAGLPRAGLGLDFLHPRTFTEIEWQMLEELAEATGQAIARARLLEAESTARRNATLLEGTATRLAGALTVDDVAEVSVVALTEWGADLAAVWRLDGEGVDLLAAIGVSRELQDEVARRSFPPIGTIGAGLTTDVLAHGQAVFLQTGAEYDARYRHHAATRRRHRAESLAAVPLRGSDSVVVGSLSVSSAHAYWWTEDRIGLVTGMAQQIGLALERARLLEHEHDTAMRLQEALLPDHLAAHPALAIHARYRPADRRLQVGGDWYETVARPDGRIALAVGDVVGHGLEAAATMGRLRTAFAALAQRSDCPAEVLRQMDDFAATVPSARTSTVVCAYLHPETGALSYASAGHPPMLLVTPERGAEFLEEGRSWPLAVPVHGADRGQAECRLEPGSALILYSDGLVERRGESIGAGLERLRDAAERLYRAGFHNLADALIAELTVGEAIEDDVVVVSAQRVRD